jgi:hypothetical protein
LSAATRDFHLNPKESAMANGEGDGYGEFGGGGSVHWELKVGEGEPPVQRPRDPKDADCREKHAYVVKGVDSYKKNGGDPGYFEVVLVENQSGDILVKRDGNSFKLYFKVNGKDKTDAQIRVDWGASVVVPPRDQMVPLGALVGRTRD